MKIIRLGNIRPDGMLEKGDRVIYTSEEYGDEIDNPLWGGEYGEVIGTVTGVNTNPRYFNVTWDNEETNEYEPGDLDLYIN